MFHHVLSCFIRYPNHPKRSCSWDGLNPPKKKSPSNRLRLRLWLRPVCLYAHGWTSTGGVHWYGQPRGTIKVMAIQRRQPTSPRIRGFWKAKRNHQPCGHMRPWGFLPSDYWGVSFGGGVVECPWNMKTWAWVRLKTSRGDHRLG